MHFIYILLVFALFASYQVAFSKDERSERFQEEAKATAVQMTVYHQASLSYCAAAAGNCSSSGEIAIANVLSEMPASLSSGSAYSSGFFASYTNGSGDIVTIAPSLNYSATTNLKVEVQAAVGGYLVKTVGFKHSGGRYDTSVPGVKRPDGSETTIPTSFGGITLLDNAPILIN